MDSFVTCSGLGTLPEVRRVVREKLRTGPVVDDSRTAFALRKSPVDNEIAERTSLRLHVSVTIARNIAPSATVEDLSSSARAPNLCRFPVKPSGGFHIKLLLESGGEIHSPRSGASQAWWLQAKRRPLRMQRLIYISILESFVKRFYGNRSKMYY
mgnify:CR=1 FL=1